jgi:hypothetical protein
MMKKLNLILIVLILFLAMTTQAETSHNGVSQGVSQGETPEGERVVSTYIFSWKKFNEVKKKRKRRAKAKKAKKVALRKRAEQEYAYRHMRSQ